MIDLADITIPTPAAYDSSDPNKQRENYYYMLNQIYSAAKTAGDNDPFGYLEALQTTTVTQVDLADLSVKIFGHVALVESP
jgi:hypothetical protein